ncbi:MHJ_0274 family protein [Metamycoplasma equirhinis]|uniref:DUF4381 domain-containing protein n=1 Tax=Metamycoplasma equirhinis TaxID=92402 RepID=A0ABZ0P9N9_9BACT|nr:hypothetical protein [Metamycoplasma equirhinis]TPD98760.1 hypothetical protein FJM08_01720 [Metamycoplasma equirhinis]WPB53737.1 hypothetical protein R9B83_01970 [Metamycoplasma equirhinis]
MPNSQSPVANVVLYVLMAVLLLFIIAYIIWKIVKKSVLKKRAAKAEAEKAKEILSLYYEYILSFQEIIIYSLNELKKFNSHETTRKMGEIRVGAQKLLMKLIKRDDFAYSFVKNEQYKTFVKHAELINVNYCNLWEKHIPETLKFFKEQYALVPDGEKKNICLDLVKKSIKEKYYEGNEK